MHTTTDPIDTTLRTVLAAFVGAGATFTALDVSNSVKLTHPAVRHRDIADAVRVLWHAQDGTLSRAKVARVIVPVWPVGSDPEATEPTATAWLYLPVAHVGMEDAVYPRYRRCLAPRRPLAAPGV